MEIVNKEIEKYCIERSSHPSKICDDLEKYTRDKVPMSQMLIGKLEASFLGFLIKSNGAKRVLEIGTFTGYSALAMAEHLPSDGEVITLDINPETVDIAKSYWQKSEQGNKITSIIGPALDSIDKLEGKFDLVFIDADKVNYDPYFQKVLDKLSDNGIVVFDNALWSGSVLEENPKEESTMALRKLAFDIEARDDLYKTLLPIRDGMLLVRKK